MKPDPRVLTVWLAFSVVPALTAAEPKAGENPADHLPPHISRATWFGERADWSHDGKRVLFLTKTFGDAMEIDLATKIIRNLTGHYPHHSYKASNPVVSDDGRFIAFQMAKSREAAGVGHGIFIFDLEKFRATPR
jgi:hypothetical protein